MDKKKHKHGFKIPEDYLDSFEDRLFDKIKEETLPKEDGFQVPDGYFDILEEQVMQRVSEEKKETPVIPLFSRRMLTYVAAVAAVLALIVTIAWPDGPTIEEEISELSTTTIEEYMDDGNMSLDTYEIAALFDDESLADVFIETDLFSDEILEDYLLENLDESELLIE